MPSPPSADGAPSRRWALVSRGLEGRDLALDLFRGLAILGMIFVNHPPAGVPTIGVFVHAAWHGWTLADTIFPGFLFAVGVSIAWVIPAAASGSPGARLASHAKIGRRALLLIGIGVALANLPHWSWHVSGVLVQIGCCYLVAAYLRLHLGWRGLLAVTLAVLVLHWLALTQWPLPGFGTGQLTPEGSVSGYVDRWVLGLGLDVGTHGPLSIFSAIASTTIGVLAGLWLRGARPEAEKTLGLFAAGLGLLALGLLWERVLPINKPLWTGSYAVLMAGLSMQLLAVLRWSVALRPSAAWHVPLRAAGVNALAFYVLAQLMQRVLVYGRLPSADGPAIRLRVWIWEQAFVPWVSGSVGALVYTACFLALCFAPMWWLYRREIVIRL
jgi:predicted acyltransferase